MRDLVLGALLNSKVHAREAAKAIDRVLERIEKDSKLKLEERRMVRLVGVPDPVERRYPITAKELKSIRSRLQAIAEEIERIEVKERDE